MASFMSAITLLGVSSENYRFGTQFVVINFAYGIATPLCAYWYLPVFFKLQATSAYHYLELRFGPLARLFASLAFSLQMILYMGIVLYAPALALEAVTGLSKTVAVISIGLVCTFYSTIGGMKAVVITDVFQVSKEDEFLVVVFLVICDVKTSKLIFCSQSCLMFAAVYVIVIKASIDAGGIGEVWKIAVSGRRVEFDKSLKKSQQALWISWPVLTVLSLSTSFSGLAIYSRYHKCDPKLSGRISAYDQLMPLYVVDSMNHIPGLSGLFVAGIFSGSLSTVSSAVNSLSAVTLEDYLKVDTLVSQTEKLEHFYYLEDILQLEHLILCLPQPAYARLTGTPLPESRGGLISKILALFYGLLCLGIAFAAERLGGVLQASLSIFGVVGGPLFGLFTLGMFCPSCNEIVSILSSTMVDICLVSDDNYFILYKLSYMWYVVIGFLVTVLVGVIVSHIVRLCSKKAQKQVNPDLFVPFIANYLRLKQGLDFPLDEDNMIKHENGIGIVRISSEVDRISPKNESHKNADSTLL
ncbi:putative sodium-dependent multivitamin transporter [Blattella germanica]|nr:putative sodium-dependent multivitamin transporter [Blattella germanica]